MITYTAVDGIGEIVPGDDLGEIVARHADLRDGDVLVVTSKIVSKAEGRATTADRDSVLRAETERVVARRGGTVIVRTRHGLTMAAAGIDASNTTPGTLLPLPVDPDVSAARIRRRLRELTGCRVGVVVSDTAGRAWRVGQTDIAIGCAGVLPAQSFAGSTDPYGNPLVVTLPAIADQIAGGAELASGKFGGRPVVVVRGLDPAWVLDEDGPGAASLTRPDGEDLFGYGSAEAVVQAVATDPDRRGFGSPATLDLDAVVTVARRDSDTAEIAVDGDTVTLRVVSEPGALLAAGALAQRIEALATAHGLCARVVTEFR